MELTDEELRRVREKLVRRGFGKIKNWDAAMEIAGAVLCKPLVWDAIARQDKAYVYTAHDHEICDWLEKKEKEKKKLVAAQYLAEYITRDLLTKDDALKILREREKYEQLRRAMSKLKSHDKQLLEYYYFKGMTWGEIAKLLGIKENTAKTRGVRARSRLKGILLDQGFDTH